jgi:hypothetical protein
VLALAPVTSFYGSEPGTPRNPGVGQYTEISFAVVAGGSRLEEAMATIKESLETAKFGTLWSCYETKYLVSYAEEYESIDYHSDGSVRREGRSEQQHKDEVRELGQEPWTDRTPGEWSQEKYATNVESRQFCKVTATGKDETSPFVEYTQVIHERLIRPAEVGMNSWTWAMSRRLRLRQQDDGSWKVYCEENLLTRLYAEEFRDIEGL